MGKVIKRLVALATLFTAVSTQALPIVEADAFTAGDNKAVLETSTGLVWMDFGVNSNTSYTPDMHYTNIVANLSTMYPGWRLATAGEVKHLWLGLFGNLGIPIDSSSSIDMMINDFNNETSDTFNSVRDLFGYTFEGYAYASLSEPGKEEKYIAINTQIAVGFFPSDDGFAGLFHYATPVEGNLWYAASYESMSLEISQYNDIMYGAMLVKGTNVPESSSLMLIGLGLLGLGFSRRRVTKS